ncbi:MAG: (d)CMP kinase [Candidatus Neomarinimicrobiota bacterium]
MIIAIDGPSASGKSTTAKGVSEVLSILYIDTGAMYRALTYGFIKEMIDLNNSREIKKYLSNVDVNFNSKNEICLNNRSLSLEIRSKNITSKVSSVSAISSVRDKMVKLQRKIAEGKSCILEGRDIGTVVFPHAKYKFFMSAELKDRAERRMLDYIKNGEDISIDQVKKQIEQRDKFDSTRKNSPLRMSKDAVLIDTSRMSINEQINKIVDIVVNKQGKLKV